MTVDNTQRAHDEIIRRRLLGLLSDQDAGSSDRPTRLHTRLTEEYELFHPLVGAGMGFVALPQLVAAVCDSGGLGVLGVSPEPPPAFAERLQQIQSLTPRPFGVDFLLAISPLFGPVTVDAHIQTTLEAKAAGVPIQVAVFHLDTPPVKWVKDLQAAGIKVWAQVPSLDDALANLDIEGSGVAVDALIAQGTESGGHTKSTTPLKTLLEEILLRVGERVPVLAAGGIADGADVAWALLQGAAGVWVGTRLVASEEAYAHLEWKQRILRAGSQDTVITQLFGPELPRTPYRVLRTRIVEQYLDVEDQICAEYLPSTTPIGMTPFFVGTSLETPPAPMPKFSAIPPTPQTVGDIDEMSLAAGMGVDRIDDIRPVSEIIEIMMREAHEIVTKSSHR